MQLLQLEVLLRTDTLRLINRLTVSGELAENPVTLVPRLRAEGFAPDTVGIALSQAKLRALAETKFGEFAHNMLFTLEGLQQATRLRVAALHAARFRAANISEVADIGCGIGADSLAFAAAGIRVTAVECDQITAAIASYNLSGFNDARVECATAEAFTLPPTSAAFFDPARRTQSETGGSRRTYLPQDFSPNLSDVFDTARVTPTGVKLGPGHPHDQIPADCEAQWVSVDGSAVEMTLWFGALARSGNPRTALVLTSDGSTEIAGNSQDPAVEPLREYLFEPDPAVIRARAIGTLAEHNDLTLISPNIAYLSGSQPLDTPLARCYRILESHPFNRKRLKKRLSELDAGELTVKKRGADINPAELRSQLAPKGSRPFTLVVTRLGDQHRALIVEPQ